MLMNRAFGRIGTNYVKLGDYTKAIDNFQRSLTEHRTPEILTKLRDVEKTKAETERLAYIDPGKADEAREQGNTLFKKADYPGAVKAYSEAIKRSPEDPRGYANRAAAYIKLASFPDAVKVRTPPSSYERIYVRF
jgi:stress-induced-phosphoprotein 1